MAFYLQTKKKKIFVLILGLSQTIFDSIDKTNYFFRKSLLAFKGKGFVRNVIISRKQFLKGFDGCFPRSGKPLVNAFAPNVCPFIDGLCCRRVAEHRTGDVQKLGFTGHSGGRELITFGAVPHLTEIITAKRINLSIGG